MLFPTLLVSDSDLFGLWATFARRRRFACRKCIQHVYYQTQCVPGETTQNCKDDERVVDEVENPAEMPIKDVILGPVWTWEFQVAGSTRTTQDYQFSLESHYTEAEFPSIHDERRAVRPVCGRFWKRGSY